MTIINGLGYWTNGAMCGNSSDMGESYVDIGKDHSF